MIVLVIRIASNWIEYFIYTLFVSGCQRDNGSGAEGGGGCGYRHTHLLSVADVLQGEGWRTPVRNLSLVHASGEASVQVAIPSRRCDDILRHVTSWWLRHDGVRDDPEDGPGVAPPREHEHQHNHDPCHRPLHPPHHRLRHMHHPEEEKTAGDSIKRFFFIMNLFANLSI